MNIFINTKWKLLLYFARTDGSRECQVQVFYFRLLTYYAPITSVTAKYHKSTKDNFVVVSGFSLSNFFILRLKSLH